MDIYAWTVYRIFLLRIKKQPFVKIPWEALQAQFGSGYGSNSKKLTVDNQKEVEQQGLYDFKRKFLEQLNKVTVFYPELANNVESSSDYLMLRPTKLHIKRADNKPAIIQK